MLAFGQRLNRARPSARVTIMYLVYKAAEFVCKIPLLARALGLKARPSARATIGYFVYNGRVCARAKASYIQRISDKYYIDLK